LCDLSAEKTPSSKELDELTDRLRAVDAASDRRLDKYNVRIWFQNRRREQKELASSSLSSAAATATTATSPPAETETAVAAAVYIAGGHPCPASTIRCGQWPAGTTSGDGVLDAVTRLSRYCGGLTDVTNTRSGYWRAAHVDR